MLSCNLRSFKFVIYKLFESILLSILQTNKPECYVGNGDWKFDFCRFTLHTSRITLHTSHFLSELCCSLTSVLVHVEMLSFLLQATATFKFPDLFPNQDVKDQESAQKKEDTSLEEPEPLRWFWRQ